MQLKKCVLKSDRAISVKKCEQIKPKGLFYWKKKPGKRLEGKFNKNGKIDFENVYYQQIKKLLY